MAWTFDGVTFEWLRQDRNGVATRATWNQPPNLRKSPLLGTRATDIADIGYLPAAIRGAFWVAAADAAGLIARNGQHKTLSDGTSSWLAAMELDASQLAMAEDGYTGDVTFTATVG